MRPSRRPSVGSSTKENRDMHQLYDTVHLTQVVGRPMWCVAPAIRPITIPWLCKRQLAMDRPSSAYHILTSPPSLATHLALLPTQSTAPALVPKPGHKVHVGIGNGKKIYLLLYPHPTLSSPSRSPLQSFLLSRLPSADRWSSFVSHLRRCTA